VSDSAVVFLAIMAVALVVMAAAQIALMVVGLRVAKQVTATAEELRREVRPLLDKVHQLTDEATRVTTLAYAQVERVDMLMASTAQRVDDTLGILQGFIAGPVRQGSAMVAAFKAAMTVVRGFQDRRSVSREPEEDALFVG
jgi:hypothetical protein